MRAADGFVIIVVDLNRQFMGADSARCSRGGETPRRGFRARLEGRWCYVEAPDSPRGKACRTELTERPQ
jgi:hypothetical protein